MEINSLTKLYVEQLKDLYSAETQLVDALPKMAEAATNAQLKKAFLNHLKETEGQKERLDQIFDGLGEKGTGHTCKAMKGLIKEAEELIAEDIDKDLLDAGLIIAAQKVEHYEIAGYGSLATYANTLGKEQDEELLRETLDQEHGANDKLNDLALSIINPKAAKHKGTEAHASRASH